MPDLSSDLKHLPDPFVTYDPAFTRDLSRGRTSNVARIRICIHEMDVRAAHSRVDHFNPDLIGTERL
jgi:hypothetical protein